MIETCDTMTQALEKAQNAGYNCHFKTSDDGVECLDNSKTYKPSQMKIIEIKRFEGMTNPSDSSEVMLLETNDGFKGTLVMSYGAKNDQNSTVIRDIPHA